MRIMPVSGFEIGFSAKQWKRIESAVLRKAQASPADEDNYFNDMNGLQVKSSVGGKMETEESTEVSRDPGSLWGGREHQVGFGYSVDVTVILEGDVRYPYGGTDQEVAASIAKDFDDNWGENNACYAAVKEAGSELFGENEEVTHSTSGTASKVGDKTYRVTLTFTAKVSNSESAGDARQRHEDARGEAMGDRMRDEGR